MKSIKSLAMLGLLAFIYAAPTAWAADPSASDTAAVGAEGASTSMIVLFVVGLIVVSVGLVALLTRWSNKQDNIGNMMTFCIKYLMETRNETQKHEAAKALGGVKDPAALLILVDVINDEGVSDNLRKTAGEALRRMSKTYGKYENLINGLLAAVDEKDHQKSIDLLMANFERDREAYVQSAYVIARELVRSERYAEAREWLHKAEYRNKKTAVYVHQIPELIEICNEKLFSEGDVLFKVGDYYDALEYYALASSELGQADKKRFAAHFRLACVYCKLDRYENAYQETLHALHDGHETDLSFELNKLLKRERGEIGGTPDAEARRSKIHQEIDRYVSRIMNDLAGSPEHAALAGA